jgi:DNA-binding MarR family transcriptional regulator
MAHKASPPLAGLSPDGLEPCTALMVRRLARRITQIYDEALTPHGLTIGQVSLLAALRRSRGIGIGALAAHLSADASTVSRLLRPLESTGLLRLAADPDDRRGKQVWLTDAGFEARGRAIAGWRAAQDQVRDQLGASRLAALRFMLDDAHAHL